jgi:L-lactate dehydrogenase complex protein LldG
MNGKARDKILSSLELALGFPARDGALCTSQSSSATPQWLASGEQRQDLEDQMASVSTQLHWAENIQEAHDIIRAILVEHTVKKAVRWEHPLLEVLKVDDLLSDAGVELYLPTQQGKNFPHVSACADLGITAAEAVLVESGTVVIRAQSSQERSTSLIPPVHLAIVTAGQVLQSVRDMAPLFREWIGNGGSLPSAIHLVSGPSRTADIEFTLILGAHGPKALHLLVLQEPIRIG